MDKIRIRFAFLALACCLTTVTTLAADVAVDRVAADRAALIAQYESLRPMTEVQRKDFYAEQSPDVQSNLWIVHLERFLTAHPELTVEQRSVIYEGLGILRSGHFNRLYSTDPTEVFRANEDLRHVSNRAQQAFSQDLGAQAFGRLGPGTPAPVAADPLENRWRVTANIVPYCSCSTQDSWCDMGVCKAVARTCRPTTGCGTWWQYGCDGLCY